MPAGVKGDVPADAQGDRPAGVQGDVPVDAQGDVPAGAQIDVAADARGDAGSGVLREGALPWVVSGRGADALRAQAERLRAHVAADPALSAEDVGLSLACTRATLEDRAVVLGGDREELLGGLDALIAGEPAANVVQGVAGGEAGEVVFLFPGQGSQWEGMALALLDASPVFAASLRACGEALAPHIDWSLEDVLRAHPDAPSLARIEVVQPVLFAVMVALAELWRACGVRPAAVVGHSQGEIAAAYVAGGLSLEDAARLVALRSQVLSQLVGRGGVVSVSLAARELAARLERWGGRIVIAGVNGPASVAVAGDPEALKELVAELESEGVRAREVPATVASHCSQVEPLREELLDVLSTIAPRAGGVPFYSTVTGGPLDTAELNAEYWYRNTRQTVEFEQAVRALLAKGQRTFVEVSPHPVLTAGAQETAEQALGDAGEAFVTGSLRRGEGGAKRLLRSLAEVWVRGVAIDWGAIFRDSDAEPVALPTYAFQRERFWLEPATGAADVALAGMTAVDHPLLSATIELADGGGRLFTSRLSLQTHPWLADHAVMGVVLLPGTAFVELALSAGRQLGCELVQELAIEAPLVLPEQGAIQLQLAVGEPDQAGCRPLSISARPEGAAPENSLSPAAWTRHAAGVLAPAAQVDAAARASAAEWAGGLGSAWPPPDAEVVAVEDLYDRLSAEGYDYGPLFQGLRGAWRRGDELLAEVSLPSEQIEGGSGFVIHPALLDAALHAMGLGAAGAEGGDGRVRLPFVWSDVCVYQERMPSLRVRLSPTGPDAVSMLAADEHGRLIASVRELALRPISAGQLAGARASHHDSLFSVEWTALAVPAEGLGGELAILLEDDAEVPVALLDGLRSAGVEPVSYVGLDALGESVDTLGEATAVVLVDGTAWGDAAARSGRAAASERAAASGRDAEEDVPFAVHRGVRRALELVQAWLAQERFAACRLVVMTRGAVAVRAGEDVPDLVGGAVWGLLRSAQLEYPGRLVLIDLDGEEPSWRALTGALALEDRSAAPGYTGGDQQLAVRESETQLAVREGEVYTARLARVGSSGALVAPAGVAQWRLDAGGGTLEGLGLVACPEVSAPLDGGEVRVGVRAAGVNFRDVLIAVGMYPGGGTIGGEGAGVVEEVGPGVDGLAPGDRVMGLLAGAFGPIAVADQRMVVPIPEGWSFTQAASVPIAFLTAYYALVDLAGLKRGERVLVHAATGGVGMAAMQLARHLGAEVFATASSAKWGVLRVWAWIGRISPPPATWSSGSASWRRVRGGAWTWCSTAWRGIRGRDARAAARRRPLHRDGQDRHPRSRSRRRDASGRRLSGVRAGASRPRADPRDAGGADRDVRAWRA